MFLERKKRPHQMQLIVFKWWFCEFLNVSFCLTDRESRWSRLLVPVLLLESFCPTPPPRLPSPPPISTPHPPCPTTPAPTLTPPLITPPPLSLISTPPSPSASSPPPPSFAPLDLGAPAHPSPRRPPPRSPSARLRWPGYATCPLPATSHTHTYRPTRSGERNILFWYQNETTARRKFREREKKTTSMQMQNNFIWMEVMLKMELKCYSGMMSSYWCSSYRHIKPLKLNN